MTRVPDYGKPIAIRPKMHSATHTKRHGSFPSEGVIPHRVVFRTERFDERTHGGIDASALAPSKFSQETALEPVPRAAAAGTSEESAEQGAATEFWREPHSNDGTDPEKGLTGRRITGSRRR